MITVLIIGILLAIAFPSFIYTREQTRRKACIANLRKIEWAKDAYIMDKRLDLDAEPTAAELYPANGTGYLKSVPKCQSSGTYSINKGGEDPTCTEGLTAGHIIYGN